MYNIFYQCIYLKRNKKICISIVLAINVMITYYALINHTMSMHNNEKKFVSNIYVSYDDKNNVKK